MQNGLSFRICGFFKHLSDQCSLQSDLYCILCKSSEYTALMYFIFLKNFKFKMNAARVCKLRNGVKKPIQFLLFSLAKGGTKTIAHLSIAEGSSFLSLDRRIYDCELRNERKRFNPSEQ
jgi:hypothetical protein